MSPERSRVVWVAAAAAVFVLSVLLAGIFLFYPRNQADSAPASIGNTAAPKPLDPQDFFNAPAALAPDKERGGNITVIYGQKPEDLPALDSSATAATASGGSSDTGPVALAPADSGQPVPTASSSAATTDRSGTPGMASPATSPTSTSTVGSRSLSTSGAAKSPSTGTAATPVAAAPRPSANPPSTPTTATKVATQKKPATSTEYWIQAASFTERAKADRLKESLAAKGVAALISVKDINGVSWYRVRVGPYSSSKEAAGWLARVKTVAGCAEAYVSSQVVTRP